YMSRNVQKYGTYDAAYRKGYNNGYTGAGPFADIPKSYVPRTTGLSPSESVSVTVEKDKSKAANPYLQGVAFTQAWHSQIDPIYEAYAGRPATRAEAQKAINNGTSTYHLQVQLATKKSFIGSPVWKSNAPGYIAAYQQIYGNVRPPNLLVSYAIVHDLGASFVDYLRQSKGYVRSQEFKQNTASMANIYRKIFGEPDEHGINVIKRVTAAGWNADQFADFLRKQPDYYNSSEFRQKTAGLAQVFGNVQTST